MKLGLRSDNHRIGNKPAGLLGRLFNGLDFGVMILVLVLTIFGVTMVFSAGYYQTMNLDKPDPTYYLVRQLVFVILGWGLLLILANIDYHIYMKLGVLALVISLALLILVYIMGTTANNAQRWIEILGIRITPSEISKLAMIVFTSVFLAKNPQNARTVYGISVLIVVMLAHIALIITQPNLSTAVVLGMIMFAIMIVGEIHLLTLLIPALGVAGLGYYIMTVRKPYHWYLRLIGFVDPLSDLKGAGYQVSQGLIGLGNGGLTGLGIGKSITKNMYLPEPQNDFILAIIGEELGFIGNLFLMLENMLLIFKLFMIALNAKDKLGMFLATGIGAMLGLQVVINVAVVTSSMPATGITLPFISYGGTSLLVFMMSMGIALNIERRSKE